METIIQVLTSDGKQPATAELSDVSIGSDSDLLSPTGRDKAQHSMVSVAAKRLRVAHDELTPVRCARYLACDTRNGG